MRPPGSALWRGAALCGTLVAILAGCGSSESSTTSTVGTTEAAKAAAAARKAAEERAPPRSSATLRAIYAQFQPPKPNFEVKGSAAAIAAGRQACAGKTPVQVKEMYYPRAVAMGKLDPKSSQAMMIGHIDTYERHISSNQSFIAGQLAADAYQAILPKAISQFGYQGCVYALARQLEQRLAPKG
jgi:hypothetical protein